MTALQHVEMWRTPSLGNEEEQGSRGKKIFWKITSIIWEL